MQSFGLLPLKVVDLLLKLQNLIRLARLDNSTFNVRFMVKWVIEVIVL
jgi:hypothetical protein